MRKSVVLLLCVLSAPLAASCGGRKTANEPAVATPSLSFSKERVPIGSVVTLTYKFVVAPDAKFSKDYWIFVHVLDPEGEQMWTDDHQPPTPTTQWKPGQTIEYTRLIFVPNYPYIGEAIVRLGMYDPPTNARLVLNAPEASRREYVVAKFQVLSSSENIFIMPGAGWYQAESDSRSPQNEWSWTKKDATLSFKNPKKDSTLYLQYDARADQFNPPQQVTVRTGDQVVAQFAADSRTPMMKVFPVTAAQMGSGDTVTLSIGVDRTFKPGGGDPRELGIRVFHTYVEPK